MSPGGLGTVIYIISAGNEVVIYSIWLFPISLNLTPVMVLHEKHFSNDHYVRDRRKETILCV